MYYSLFAKRYLIILKNPLRGSFEQLQDTEKKFSSTKLTTCSDKQTTPDLGMVNGLKTAISGHFTPGSHVAFPLCRIELEFSSTKL